MNPGIKISCRMVALIILFSYFPAEYVLADTVYMKNKQTYSGRIVGQTRTTITIETDKGIKILKKLESQRITYGTDEKPVEQPQKENIPEKTNIEPNNDPQIKKKLLKERAQKRNQEKKSDSEDEAAPVEVPVQPNYKLAMLESRLNTEYSVWAQMHRDWQKKERDEEVKSADPAKNNADEAPPHPEVKKSGIGLSALLRSALFPGWGQYYRGEKDKGIIHAGAYSTAGLYSIYFYRQYILMQSARTESTRQLMTLTAAFPSYQAAFANYYLSESGKRSLLNAKQNFSAASLVVAGIYLWSILDILGSMPVSSAAAGNTGSLKNSGIKYALELQPVHEGENQNMFLEEKFSAAYMLRF